MRRIAAVVIGALILSGGAFFFFLRDEGTVAPVEGAPGLDEMADRVGAPIMRLVSNGEYEGRGGEVIFVPRPNYYLGPDVDLTRWGTDDPEMFTSHPNPWAYLTRVPVFVYAPGRAPVGAESYDEVELVDLAPTIAQMLGMDGFAVDGEPLPGIDYDRGPPKLIFTVVMDGGGWNVLRQHPAAWNELRSLARQGMTYKNAIIGSTPAMTGAIHANIGTGVYPKTHGIPTNPYFVRGDPRNLLVPTIGDLWDESHGNRPLVGAITVLSTQLGMLGHGAQRDGGDHDIGVFWDETNHRWIANTDYYELPDTLGETDLDTLAAYEEELDGHDSFDDGHWFDDTIDSLRVGLRRASTPAFARYEGDEVVELLRTQPWGDDELTDLFYVQMKSLDQAGHNWNMVNPEVGDVLAETSRQIARFKAELDREVGVGEYVMMITADHGQQPLAHIAGGWMINAKELERDIEERFGVDVRIGTHYVNLLEEGADQTQIARFLGTYTVGDNIAVGIPGEDRVAPALRRERIFVGAFPGAYLRALSAEEIESFGESEFPQGDLIVDPPSS
ncbi:MAG: alkaline phosphatase family protein [Actinomycetota bacterium]|nr:alkaline phosphatase family protein [Actinomycetota bacterium]